MHCDEITSRISLAFFLFGCVFVGCSSNQPSEVITTSLVLLQRGEYQEALDQLHADDTAQSHYLQSVALSYLGKHDAAGEQIDKALAEDGENIAYQCFRQRLKLLDTDPQAVKELIGLYQAHPSSAAACLCAFYAYEVQAAVYRHGKQGKQSSAAHKSAAEALETAATLAEQVPEFQRELFKLALALRLPKAVENLSQKLQKVAPDDPTLASDRIATLLLTDPDQALAEAKKQYLINNKSESAAIAYAASLVTSQPNQQHDAEFKLLFDAFPDNAEIVSKYAAYLARSGRADAAMDVFQQGVKQQKTEFGKKHLMRLAVFVALESKESELAKSTLESYRKPLDDPLLIDYFEGRLLYLQKDHAAAIAKLRHVVEVQKDAVGSGRKLAKESLHWIMKILADDAVKKQLEKTNKMLKPKSREELKEGENPDQQKAAKKSSD